MQNHLKGFDLQSETGIKVTLKRLAWANTEVNITSNTRLM